MKRFITWIKKIIDRQEEAQIAAHAGNATFFLTLSVFPLIMLLFSLLQLFFGSAEELIHNNLIVVPEVVRPLWESILTEIYNSDSASLVSITAIMTLYSASRGIRAMILGVNVIHHSRWDRSFLYQTVIGIIYTLAIILTIVGMLALLVFGNRIFSSLRNRFPALEQLEESLSWLRYLVMAVVLCVVFTFFYTVCPNKRIPFFTQIPAALFSSVGWLLFSYVFSFYADNFGNYSYTYGSLTMVILLMVWCYFLMDIFLLGGVLGALHLEAYEKRHL